ncbi:efflux RND transporter periplasmic adaptor subunit [Ginsengibacter hankyongi]|uniref:Efflux RND transporter periplasmic adaptor subunit n=1 Tax=Ginsengibacter hankyongi TaxID=2607284 RepID=A0A5J5IHM5_9BACT|nr:efflux RND transporter periplasmic adaptor subunit [Ginsengibacter hankyongi]KAA9040575.1 efflux RND transporter periplasmic adaptor subunit [Ginsengibacter hankyongi]
MSMIANTKNILQLFTVIGFLALSSCSTKNKTKAEPNTDSAVVVTVATPSGNDQQAINISGQVEASQSANISTRVMGYITKLNVKVGDHVNKGQLIASISNNDIVAKRAQVDASIAEANDALQNAQKDYDRFTALYKQQSATAKELDNATLQYNSAKSRLESAKQMRNEVNAMLAYTTLTAPFSGTVTQKLADAGSMANPGMPIVTIEQSGSYQISAAVPETQINQVKQGQSVTVNIKSINKIFTGKVTQLNQSSQFTGGQYLIKVSIPDKEKNGLYAGMYANLSIASSNKVEVDTDAVLVPVSSIINKDQLTGLYTISANNTALLRWVRLGKTFGDKAEVLSGLGKNEQFIVSADGKIYNGIPVKIK